MCRCFMRASACFLTYRRCLPLCLLGLVVGCPAPRAVEHVEVSGKVFYQGKPLPGGRVTFITVKGGFASSANIEEDGKYQINAPVGDTQIGVDNEMLRVARGAPAKQQRLQRPGSEDPHPMKGRYVSIPDKYASPDQSGLTYKVEKGAQTHDIKLD